MGQQQQVRPVRRVWTIAVAAAACGIAASRIASLAAHSQGGQPGGSKAGTIGACSLLTKEEIKKLLGDRTPALFDQVPSSEESLANGGSECFLPGITIQLDAHPVAAFEETAKRYGAGGRTKFEPASGIGDAAYFYEQDPGKDWHIVGVYTKVGQHVLTVSMDVNAPESAESLRPLVLTLTKAAAAKLK